jgi:hypothetical protein
VIVYKSSLKSQLVDEIVIEQCMGDFIGGLITTDCGGRQLIISAISVDFTHIFVSVGIIIGRFFANIGTEIFHIVRLKQLISSCSKKLL